MVQNLIALQRSEKNLMLSKSSAEKNQYAHAVTAEDTGLRSLLDTTKGLVTEERAVLLDDFERLYNIFRNTQDQVIAFSRENGNVKARALSLGASHNAYLSASHTIKE
jgi:hypothetical protein